MTRRCPAAANLRRSRQIANEPANVMVVTRQSLENIVAVIKKMVCDDAVDSVQTWATQRYNDTTHTVIGALSHISEPRTCRVLNRHSGPSELTHRRKSATPHKLNCRSWSAEAVSGRLCQVCMCWQRALRCTVAHAAMCHPSHNSYLIMGGGKEGRGRRGRQGCDACEAWCGSEVLWPEVRWTPASLGPNFAAFSLQCALECRRCGNEVCEAHKPLKVGN